MDSIKQFIFPYSKIGYRGSFLVVQWLRLRAFSAGGGGGVGSIPSQGTKIPHAPEQV